MSYRQREQQILLVKIASQLYNKQCYSSVVLILTPLVESDNNQSNLKVCELLAKSYYNLGFYKKCRQISLMAKSIIQVKHQNANPHQQASFLNLIILSEIKLNMAVYHEHRQELLSILKYLKIDKSQEVLKTIDDLIQKQKKIVPLNVGNVYDNFQKLMQKSRKQKYLDDPDMPVYIVSTSWMKRFQAGSAEPIDSFDILETPNYFDLNQTHVHMNCCLRPDTLESQDYIFVPYEPWKLLHSVFGGTEIKRWTIQIEDNVIVQCKYSRIRVLIVTPRRIKEICIEISRKETFAKFRDHLKRMLIWQNVIEKEIIKRSIKLMLVKGVSRLEHMASIVAARDETEIIQNIETIEVNDSSEFEQLGMLPNQFLIAEFVDSVSIFESKKQILSNQHRCLTCAKRQNIFLCECKTVSFCSQICRRHNLKHKEQCQKLLKQKNSLSSLIRMYGINMQQKLPSNLAKDGKTGLENIGNTCFMNAALQCVVATQDLSYYFFKNRHLEDINIKNLLGSQGRLACAYGEFLKEMYFTNRKAIEPRELKKIIEKKNNQFAGYQQQDSQQFVSYFLDLMHEDLNRVKQKPIVESIESDGRPDEVISKLTLQNYHKRNKSIITDLMVGQYRSQLCCPDCKRTSITFDPYMTVTLPLPNTKEQKIDISGYFIALDGAITKIEERVGKTKTLSYLFSMFRGRNVCAALVGQRKITRRLDSTVSCEATIVSKDLLFVYEIESGDIEIQLALVDGIGALVSFTRRIFKSNINSLQQLYEAIVYNFKDPVVRYRKQLSQTSEFFDFCRKNEFFSIQAPQTIAFPMVKGFHKINLKISPDLQKQVKLLVSNGAARLEAPQSGELNIERILSNFSLPEKLTQQNSWYCNKCKEHKLATKKLSLYSTPKYLIVHLKRFSNKIQSRYVYNLKIETPIKLKQTEIINNQKYKLYGVVNHMGTMSGGHYTSYILKDTWYYCDDDRIRAKQLSGEYAYLLFYRLVE